LEHSAQEQEPSKETHPSVNNLPATDLYQKFQDLSSPPQKNQLPDTYVYLALADYKMATAYPPSGGHPGAYPPGHPPGHAQQNGAGAGAVPDSYFTESRKGEVNELRNLLRNFSTERDFQKKRDIIKKVIAYMTLGIDVSRLFSEMMLAIETRDLVIKKMVYLFLCNYATTHPELAQMCTNTLQKDCGNDDPMVRGLALRALCSLHLPQMVEYISEPLRRSLTDHHAYVRKTGVMGILKLYHLDQEAFETCNFVDILYEMLRDPDASVVSNSILVLNEVMDGGMAINRAIMLHLLNRIHEFSEFGILHVLELVPRYIPANEEEGFQIMNLLDPVLRTSNSGAVVATIRAFIAIAQGNDFDTLKIQVVSRVKAPLITHVSSGSPELVYCLLQNVETLVDLCPGIFDDEYRQFYIRYHEPTHIKYLKMDILPKLANPENAPDICAELAECVADANDTMSRLAVRSMARIACRDTGGPGCAESITRRLVELLDLNVPHICSEAATALSHIVRKHPALKPIVAPPLPRALKYVTEPSGKASIIYLLGECGENVREAPYALEKLIDTYDEMQDASVKEALLTSTVKLFLVRPPEVQHMLGRLLAKATDDVSSQDLHDRALAYYRLLRSGMVESVVKTNVTITQNFCEENDADLRAALLEEFNTLSILYGKTSENFIAPEYQVHYKRMPVEHPLAPGDTSTISFPPPAPAPEGGGFEAAAAPPPLAAPALYAPAHDATDVMDLLGFGDTMLPTMLSLVPNVTMSGDVYQSTWGSISDADATVTTIPLNAVPTSTDAAEAALARNNIMTMASGELPTEFKFFLYAKDTSDVMFLLQGNVSKSPGEPLLIITIKATGGTASAKIEQLVELIRSSLN
jgi:vesicle coat complex subunit